MEASSGDCVNTHVSNILKPTLQDNDFLQSFVRIGLDDGDSKKKSNISVYERKESRDCMTSGSRGGQDTQDQLSSGRRNKDEKKDTKSRRRGDKNSLEFQINEQKSKKVRRRKGSSARRQEEVYTDKDRAAAVNLGTRDIIQSLKIKRRQDRNKMMQIPEEAEPSAMLALGAREMRSGDLNIALNCINKALEISPNDRNALLARSKCYLMLGEPQKALEDAEAALNEKVKDPNNARAMFYKAEALYHLGDFELSLVYYYRGMRIRPEFDQFRLGVQKAKEAIQNILGNNSVPIKIDLQSRIEDINKFESGSDSSYEKNQHRSIVNENNVQVIEDKSSSEVSDKSRDCLPVKRKYNTPNLLGQLNVDKKYLQDLLKCPGIK
ncbi:hypothetical protein PV325_005414 [Microctonus aethiopoides]|nr:hypothetical protein PV325_005414 [Microctonus aethiopoides]KAK0094468.1 hypothetical protein PV326_010793 [Microctonus aethiopoides]